MVADKGVVEWLLEGDPSVRWQTMRDLQGRGERTVARERNRVAQAGWGARLLELQDASGQWGGGVYTPKWTSTTYTLLVLRGLGLPAGNPRALKGCRLLLDRGLYSDGGINLGWGRRPSETCVTGMVLSMSAFFGLDDERLERLAEHLLEQQMSDGGWNCQLWRGATHSSFHTTIGVLEGLRDYELLNPASAPRLREAQARAREFLLVHRLFRAHRTGRVIRPEFLRFAFPPRWHYDVLRALDYFQECRAPRDERLAEALALVRAKSRADGRWLLAAGYPGKIHFEMEKAGWPSRWNTLRALRVLKWASSSERS